MNVAFASGILLPQTFFGIDYFLGFREHFQGSAVRAIFPDVPVTAHIEQRAQRLAERLAEALTNGAFETDQKIHIVAHSMGGLDSRFLISNNLRNLRGRIASLTTICTPHRGSPIADLLLGPERPGLLDPRRIAFQIVEGSLLSLGINLGGFADLTQEATAAFAQRAPDVPGFAYFSVAGVGRASGRATSLPLLAGHAHIADAGRSAEEKRNDGLVSLSSARFGKLLGEWPADHFQVVGHNADPFGDSAPFDPLPLVDQILQVVRAD
jgi:triacylglycerol lipase